MKWEHERGPRVGIAMTAIDDGFSSTHVRDFVRAHPHQAFAVKGRSTGIALLGAPSQTDVLQGGGRARHVNVRTRADLGAVDRKHGRIWRSAGRLPRACRHRYVHRLPSTPAPARRCASSAVTGA